MYAAHEKQKITKYNHRVIQIEKGTFAPLCFSTTGGMGPQSMMFVKKLANHMTRTNHLTHPVEALEQRATPLQVSLHSMAALISCVLS